MNIENKHKQQMLTQLSALLNRISAANNGKLITAVSIDPVTGNLNITYNDETTEDLGRIVGTKGTDGISVLDLQLFEDPLDPQSVFLQTTLSNGIVLRTRDSLVGYHGKSIADVYIKDEALHFILDDINSSELPPIPIAGLVAISVTGARILDGDLIFAMSNGTEINAGLVGDLQGRGIVQVKLEDGMLKAAFTDAPAVFENIGNLDGIQSLAMVGGKLVYRKSSAPGVDIELAPVVSLTGGRIEGNHLIFTTNQEGALAEIDVGQVADLKGDTGTGIATVDVVDNKFVVTLTDTTVIEIPVTGLTPIHIVGSRFDVATNEIFFTLSNGTEVASGIKEDLRGAGVASVALLANGDLNFYYDNDPTTAVKVGVIKAINSYRVDGGKIWITYNTDPETEVQVGTLLGIANMVTENGKFKVTYTDGSTSMVGSAKAIDSISVDDNFVLTVHYTDDTADAIGTLPEGKQGVGYTGASVDPVTGDLMLAKTNGQIENAGQVRLDIDNMIGSIKSFTAAAAQTEYVIDHGGAALIWVDGSIQPESAYSLAVSDRITWLAPFTGGESVRVIAFAPAGSVITGKGIKNITEPSLGLYQIQLENGNTYQINTVTEIDVANLPPGIKTMVIKPTGMLEVELTNGTILSAGMTNQANNTKSALINQDGDLIITLLDDTAYNAGSVLANLSITNIEIVEGNLFVTMNSGQVFDAGATGVYPTSADIDIPTGKLSITLSNGTILDAGTIVNPLMGTEHEIVCFEGQTDFPIAHGGYIPLVYMNVALLSKESLILTDPLKIVVKTPRKANDIARIILMAKGTVRVAGLESEATAPNDSFYGKKDDVVGWYPATSNKIGIPFDFVAGVNQTIFNNVTHGGEVEVFIDGLLKHEGVNTTQTNKVILTPALAGGEKVRIIALTAPSSMGTFAPSGYAMVTNDVYNHGGSAIRGKWVARQFNNLRANGLGAILQNNRITLPAGVYYVRGWGAGYGLQANAVKLHDVTSLVDLLVGAGAYFEGQGLATIEGYFTLERQSAIVLQHNCHKSVGSFGYGKVGSGDTNGNASQAALGVPATLAQLEFWKLN